MRTALASLFSLLLPLSSFAQSGVTLSNFSPATVAAFGTLTVNGAGFDPANAAISVVVSPRGGAALTIPVYSATATAVTVVIPPVVSLATADLFDAPVVADVQVVQVTRSSVTTSNVLGGVTLNPAPQSSRPAGSVTRAFINTTVELNNDLRTAAASMPQIAGWMPKIDAMASSQSELASAAQTIAADRSRLVKLSSSNGVALLVGERSLRLSDRALLAFVKRTNEQYASAAGSAGAPGPMAVPLGCSCSVVTGDPEIDKDFCEFRKNPCQALALAKKVVPAAAAGVYGTMIGGVIGFATNGLVEAGAFGVSRTAEYIGVGFSFVASQAMNHLAAVSAGAERPTIPQMARDLGANIIDAVTKSGLPVFGSLNSGLGLLEAIEIDSVNTAAGPAPTARGGAVLPAPPSKTPSGTRPVTALVIQPDHSVTNTVVAASETPATVPFTAAVVPPLGAGGVDGLYSGQIDGNCVLTGSDGKVNDIKADGGIFFIVKDGRFDGGTISSSGAIRLGESFWGALTLGTPIPGSCDGAGHLSIDGLAARGAFYCELKSSGPPSILNTNDACVGTWDLTRLPLPQ